MIEQNQAFAIIDSIFETEQQQIKYSHKIYKKAESNQQGYHILNFHLFLHKWDKGTKEQLNEMEAETAGI